MPTPTKGARLGGSAAHQKLMLANLATSLFEHGRITTTEAKAKRLRPLAERLITFAKRGDLHARRIVMSTIRDKDVVHHLFAEIGPRYTERPGGYTRIIKVGPRKGDNAPMALIELVEALTVGQSAVREGEAARGTRFAGSTSAPAAAQSAADDSAVSSADDTVADADATVADAGDDAGVDETHPYGAGSHIATDDGSQPDGYDIKGKESSKLYHLPEGPYYDNTNADVWFDSASAAEAAGFALPKNASGEDQDETGRDLSGEDDK